MISPLTRHASRRHASRCSAALALLLLSGCASHIVILSNKDFDPDSAPPYYTERNAQRIFSPNSFNLGAFPLYRAEEICGSLENQPLAYEATIGFTDILLSFLTVGMITSSTTYLYCEGESPWLAPPPPPIPPAPPR